MTSIIRLGSSIQSVIEGGYCIGCGVCAVLPDSPVQIKLNEVGKYQAIVNQNDYSSSLSKINAVCPFTNEGQNEDEIGYDLFAHHSMHDARIGYWRECYIGHVEEGEYRSKGSSGGFVSWLICELMSKGEIDGVLHVVPSSKAGQGEVFFQYGVSVTSDDVRSGAKSRYYGVEMSQALKYVRGNPGRYLVVGVPCFVKAIRLLCKQELLFAERILFSIAILCGHLKSVAYLEFIAWQMGVPLDSIKSFDFRHKIPTNPAKNYAVEIVHLENGVEHRQASLMSDFKGEDWGMGLFKYAACDYCDDVMGETADICAGDAWVEPYSSDSHGTNVIVVRNQYLHKTIESAVLAGRLSLRIVSPDIAAQTQEASFRHRRDGLSYRLWLKQKEGIWAPQKRVMPKWQHLSSKYRKIFKLRTSLVFLSDQACLKARKANDFALYWPQIKNVARRYHRCYHPLWVAIPRKVWRMLSKALD